MVMKTRDEDMMIACRLRHDALGILHCTKPIDAIAPLTGTDFRNEANGYLDTIIPIPKGVNLLHLSFSCGKILLVFRL